MRWPLKISIERRTLIERVWLAMDLSYQSATWLGWVKALPDDLIRVQAGAQRWAMPGRC